MQKPIKSSAIANANIALVKYWGKRDKKLILPNNSSISVTLKDLYAHTTVDFSKGYKEDIFVLNGRKFRVGTEEYDKYTGLFLRLVRKMAKTNLKAKVFSNNNFPTAAGLASSAAGFAALATAVNEALGLGLNKRDLSMLARRGSGSATRSIYGGFVKWRKGKKEDGTDSYAKQIADVKYWPDFRIIVCITTKEEKKIKSRAGMAQTVATCPVYNGWLKAAKEDLKNMEKAIAKKDFSLLGKTAERNCLKMHAIMMTTTPPIFYFNKTTINVMQSVLEWRKEGAECYFSIDASPQVKIICLEKNVKKIKEKCKRFKGVKEIIVTKPGEGVRIVKKHLF